MILILAGSFCGALLAWLHGVGPWVVVLAYVAGGWAGFLGGMPVLLAVQMIGCRLRRKQQAGPPAASAAPFPASLPAGHAPARSTLSQKAGDFPANRPGGMISSRTPRRRTQPGLRAGRD